MLAEASGYDTQFIKFMRQRLEAMSHEGSERCVVENRNAS